MAFTQAKRDLLAALATGTHAHEPREVLNEKNLLAVGDVSPEDVTRVVARASGKDYSASAHHWDKSVTVHLFEPVVEDVRWYIKVYFLQGAKQAAVFISVHLAAQK